MIGGLIVLNLISLSFFWQYRTEVLDNSEEIIADRTDSKKEVPEQARMERFLQMELGLDEEQAELFSQERKRHFREVAPIRENIRLSKAKLYEAVFNSDADSGVIYSLHQEIIQLDNEVEKLKLEHFLKLSSYCDANQKQKLKGIFHDIIIKDKNPPSRRRHNRNNH